MNTSNYTIQGFLKAKFDALRDWFIRYFKIVLSVILVICVGLTIVIAIKTNKRKVELEESAVSAESGEGADEALEEIPLLPLEKDAVPGINEFFETYYKAVMDGDTETMSNLLYYLDATEKLRAEETSKYTESASIEVYTKAGPSEGTYIALVYTELKFYDYDKPIPGMNSYYVCTKEDGSFYINEDYEPSESERRYMREVLLQDDVIDLNNKVSVTYNDMVTEDSTLADFLYDLTKEIEKNVGETLAHAESTEPTDSGEGDAEEDTQETDTPDVSGNPTSETVVTEVKTTDVVNVRTSDSETADKLGKAAIGDTFKLLEERGNGWSKVEYNGEEAFIKSDYLEPSKTEGGDAAQATETEGEMTSEESDDNETAATSGKVTVKENVRIRSGASETSDKLATAYTGEKLEVIMKQADGWTKIKYKGKTAYVKSDYVE
ncbi:MAG: SH3 domain-containing protein [Lachnospiraceae bacterium]|nr:SH3 domain-containing protein [Lachnospiraceae bacterium]